MYEIAARSPAPIAFCGDNVDGQLAVPRLFERYFMPEYEKQARPLHRHGKLMAVHMDGRVANLKHLIAQTPIDIVEALHPIPMGDLSIAEALALAGGFTQFASPKNIKLIRNTAGKQDIRKVNYNNMIEEGGEGNYLLKSGDTIVVP